MKTSLNLLKELENLGYNHEQALHIIDSDLDAEIGFENRKVLKVEEISNDLYNAILNGVKIELEAREETLKNGKN